MKTMMRLFICLFLVLITCNSAEHVKNIGRPLNVLLVSTPLAGHIYPMLALGEELVSQGHNVSLCSSDNWLNLKAKAAERRINYLSAGKYVVEDESEFRHLVREREKIIRSTVNPFVIYQLIKNISSMTVSINDVLLSYIMKQNIEQWDVIIAEEFLVHSLPCIAAQKGVPFVLLTIMPTITLAPWSYPVPLSGKSSNLDFFGRLEYTLYYMLRLAFDFHLLKIVAPGSDITAGICKEVMLPYPIESYPVLVRSAVGLDYSQVFTPLTQYVGPLLSKLKKPLPNDLDQWLQNKEKRSVIYISMGTLVSIDVSVFKAFIDAISNSKYSVVWSLNKANQYILSDIKLDSKRYHIASWVPQVTLLQHNTIAIAIIHGGSGGVHEVLSFGIPCIVVPQVGDQFDWAARVEEAGVGVRIQLNQLSSSVIKESIDALEAGEYRQRAEKMKAVIANAGGVDRARELIEFYATYGYDHLLPAPVKYRWSWRQYYNIDIRIALICTSLALAYFLLRLFKFCCNCFKRKQKQA